MSTEAHRFFLSRSVSREEVNRFLDLLNRTPGLAPQSSPVPTLSCDADGVHHLVWLFQSGMVVHEQYTAALVSAWRKLYAQADVTNGR